MSTTTLNRTSHMNGHTAGKSSPRKQLADQLDRLDAILDTLAEGLPGLVTDAVREGARLALKDVIVELLTNAELRALFVSTLPVAGVPTAVPSAQAEPSPSPEPTPPSLVGRIKSKVSAAKAAFVGAVYRSVVRVKDAVVGRYRAARAAIHAVGLAGGEAVPLRQISGMALAVGVVAGSACLYLPETVAAVVGGVSAATTAFCVQMGSWMRRMACRVGLLV